MPFVLKRPPVCSCGNSAKWNAVRLAIPSETGSRKAGVQILWPRRVAKRGLTVVPVLPCMFHCLSRDVCFRV